MSAVQAGHGESHLADLPAEITTQIISFLPPVALAKLAETCKRLHSIVHDDAHWKLRVYRLRLPHQSRSCAPFASWEQLFLAHYPYWFIPQRRLWYADGTEVDGGLAGQMLISRYDHRTGNIEGYQLVGVKSGSATHAWPEKPGVNIHDFAPRVRLHLANPEIRLRPKPGSLPPSFRSNDEAVYAAGYPQEGKAKGLASMRNAQNELNVLHSIDSKVMLARAIAPELQHESMRLWPFARLPAVDRVRRMTPTIWMRSSQSRTSIVSEANATSFERPTKHEDICTSAFRLRRQVGGRAAALFQVLSPGVDTRAVGGVATYATLPEDAYKPSKERPYQGIWVGDYAGHGCEFLLIRQKIGRAERRAAEEVTPKLPTLFAATNPPVNLDDDDDDGSFFEDAVEEHLPSPGGAGREAGDASGDEFGDGIYDEDYDPDDEIGERGRLEAIKLTGDVNVPRGEFTFVAEEIGRQGELYVAETAEFKGKRVVSSWGHIAARGFVDDVFIKADLILVSHNCLAQYWHEFGHVAFYKRVDIDHFLDPHQGDVELKL